MNNQEPFQTALGIAAILWLTLMFFNYLSAGAQLPENLAYFIGYSLAPWMISGAITGFWAKRSRVSWNWIRYGVTISGIWFLLSVVPAIGKSGR
ncbi:hypothetical protein RIVM261_061290 [Rivularia sp. IAM M-261]|nr:hypothetical protein RIVM261_061290 [Rivularia sp. IAM M-261]